MDESTKIKVFKTPKGELARMQAVHFGKILFNLEILGLAIMFTSVITSIITLLFYLVLILIAFVTLGVALISPEFGNMWSGGEVLVDISNILAASWKYVIPIVLGLGIASIVCLCFDKHSKHIARIVISSIICVIALIFLILKLINGGV